MKDVHSHEIFQQKNGHRFGLDKGKHATARFFFHVSFHTCQYLIFSEMNQ